MIANNSKDEGRQEELVPKTPKAREYHERYYLAKCRNAIRQMYSQPVTVFVCGPHEGSNELARKRLDTIKELRRIGHDANSGEELVEELQKLDTGSPSRPINVYENIAAAQSELIVIFYSSPGSIGEAHEFLNVPEIARKTMVFIDKRYRSSYGSAGLLDQHKRLRGLLDEYEPEDVASCKLMTKVIDWVRDYQAFKWMTRSNVL